MCWTLVSGTVHGVPGPKRLPDEGGDEVSTLAWDAIPAKGRVRSSAPRLDSRASPAHSATRDHLCLYREVAAGSAVHRVAGVDGPRLLKQTPKID
jgi:hypothetical protein